MQVIADVFEIAAPTGSFGEPPSLMRAEYSRVCIAKPELAGSGECRHVEVGDYRIHTAGFANHPGTTRCDNFPGETNFVKAHVNERHEFSVWGNVGH